MRIRTQPYLSLFCTLLISFFHFTVHAQPKCGFDQVHQRHLLQSPDYKKQTSQNDQRIHQWLLEKQATERISLDGRVANGAETIYEIPVVIHVMHTGGSVGTQYNPGDAQLTGMMDYLNQSFQASWAAYSGPSGGGTRVPFRFVLAQRAPDCTPTTGIVRVDASTVPDYASYGIRVQSTTGAIEQDLKARSIWPSNQYYNIWIVNRIEGKDGYAGTVGPFIAGYAYFPGAHASRDGTVMLASQAVAGQSTLPHEMGHAFNLYHTFQGADGINCPTNGDCSQEGDWVCDTDPTNEEAFFTCPSAAAINPCTGNIWNGQQFNFMHYTSCADQRFTPGQRDRMIASVNTVRVGLLTSAALRPPPALLVRPATCEPTSITFFENPNDMGPVRIQFNTLDDSSLSYTGDYRFYQDNTCNLGTTVLEGQSYDLQLSTRTNVQVVKAWIDFNDNGSFEVAEQIMESYTPGSGLSYNMYTHTQSVTIPAGAVLNRPLRLRVLADFINNYPILSCEGLMYGQSEDYSLTILPAGVLPVRFFDERIAMESGSIQFSFKAADENEVKRYTLQRAGNAGKIFTNVKEINPASSRESANEYTITDDLPQEAVWYRVLATQHDGSQYYSRILGRPSGNIQNKEQVRIFPNPTKGDINLDLPLPPGLPVRLELTDMQGRRVWTGSRTTGSAISISSGLPTGMYYLSIKAGQANWNKKIIITQ